MRPSHRSFAPFVLAGASLLLAAVSPQQRGTWNQGPRIVRAADADRSGDVSEEEWGGFVDAVLTGEGEAIDRELLKARVFASMVDANADGMLTLDDIVERLNALDANGDGRIEADEMTPRFGGGRTRAGGWTGILIAGAVATAADADGDGAVDAGERADFLGSVAVDRNGAVADSAVIEWIAKAVGSVPSDREAFTPGVFLLMIEAGFDADGNGELAITDLQALFDGVDADADGAITNAELAAADERIRRRAMQGFGGWSRAEPEVRDTSRPPLMPWQRNLEDALALVEKTGKPLLICVNIDGEVASESLAWARYRDPAFVELVKGFVPVLASPDRHNQIDYDDRGRRIPDPTFGRLIDREHVDIEPTLFQSYFKGRRVAPRHVGVAPDGTILFDLYFLGDLAELDAALQEHGKPGEEPRDPAMMSDRELLESPDALHRDHLEVFFAQADATTRARLTGLALSSLRRTQHPALVRMALRDLEQSVRQQAVWTIVQHVERTPLEFLPLAFLVCEDLPDAYTALLGAVARLGEETADEDSAQRARDLQRIFSGLRADSKLLDVRHDTHPAEAECLATDAVQADRRARRLVATRPQHETFGLRCRRLGDIEPHPRDTGRLEPAPQNIDDLSHARFG